MIRVEPHSGAALTKVVASEIENVMVTPQWIAPPKECEADADGAVTTGYGQFNL